jgi:hypothetical protein
MKKSLLLALVCLPALGFAQTQVESASKAQPPAAEPTPAAPQILDESRNQPPMLGVSWERSFNPNVRAQEGITAYRTTKSPNMTYHGGKILPYTVAKAIFWGKSWATYSGDKITGMDSWYTGFNVSNYAAATDEYTGTNGQVTAALTYQGHVVDTSAASGGSNTATILAEVCNVITSPDSSGNGYYPVYTDIPRGSANYCAWHSAGSCGSTPVQFAFFFKLDGDAGCDPQDTSGLHSQGLAAIANVSGHELSEARSDPASPGAWYDSSGAENGDKCAWTFGAPLVTFSNGTEWKIQGEWSNVAYNSGTGYANSSGQKGCLSGK